MYDIDDQKIIRDFKKHFNAEIQLRQKKLEKKGNAYPPKRVRAVYQEIIEQIGHGDFNEGLHELLWFYELKRKIEKSDGRPWSQIRTDLIAQLSGWYLDILKVFDPSLADDLGSFGAFMRKASVSHELDFSMLGNGNNGKKKQEEDDDGAGNS